MFLQSVSFGVHPFLQLVIKYQHERRTNASPEVGQVAFEKSSDTFSLQDLVSTVGSSFVCSLVMSLAALHHESPSDSVKWVGECLRG
jgi:hypothetical protein